MPRIASQSFITAGDALGCLKDIGDETYDLVITDPPYDHLERHRQIGTTTRLTKSWFPTMHILDIGLVMEQCFRVLKPDRHAYVMCNYQSLFDMRAAVEGVGFEFEHLLVWDKVKIGMGYHYRSRCEFFLMFQKGKRAPNAPGQADLIEWPSIRGGYPTEKPAGLFRPLIVNSSKPNERVLDPFCGSGSVGEAAISEGRYFQGIDLCSEAVELATKRIARAENHRFVR